MGDHFTPRYYPGINPDLSDSICSSREELRATYKEPDFRVSRRSSDHSVYLSDEDDTVFVTSEEARLEGRYYPHADDDAETLLHLVDGHESYCSLPARNQSLKSGEWTGEHENGTCTRQKSGKDVARLYFEVHQDPLDGLASSFNSQCAVGTTSTSAKASRPPASASQHSSSSIGAPTVNHFSQPEREQEISATLNQVERVFSASSSLPTQKAAAEHRQLISGCTPPQPNRAPLQSAGTNPIDFSRTHRATNNIDLLDEETVDGDGQGEQSNSERRRGIANPAGSLPGDLHRGNARGGKRDRADPDAGRIRQRRRPNLTYAASKQQMYPCVFCHLDGSKPDATRECETRHAYVSQLKKHHECRAHKFYYCLECFDKIDSLDASRAHHDSCRGKKCVTEGCSNYNQFPQTCCDHGHHGRMNSQWSEWKALFRLARPNEPIPNLDIRNGANSELAPQAAPTPGSSRRTRRDEGRERSHSPQRQSVRATGDLRRSILEHENLVNQLLEQMNSPDEDFLPDLRELYHTHMHDYQEIPASVPIATDPLSKCLRDLKLLAKALMAVVNNPGAASAERRRRLHMWARTTLRILPHTEPTSTTMQPSSGDTPRPVEDVDLMLSPAPGGGWTDYFGDCLYPENFFDPTAPLTSNSGIEEAHLTVPQDGSYAVSPGYMPFLPHGRFVPEHQTSKKSSTQGDSGYGSSGLPPYFSNAGNFEYNQAG